MRAVRLFVACLASALVAAGAACASPLTIAEPRDGGEPSTTGAFGDAGVLEAGEAGEAGNLADPVDGSDDG